MGYNEFMSREEALSFISYLKDKDEIIVESQIVVNRTMFNRYVVDLYHRAQEMADIIRKSRSSLEAYQSIAHRLRLSRSSSCYTGRMHEFQFA